jgi:GTP-binding protein
MKGQGKLKNPRFITSAVEVKQFPPENLPEIVVVGRSNVGKSSLLNHLFKTKGLVKTSATPGKTQLINFFRTDEFSFVDLPGYGFAKVPLSVRQKWGPMVESFFKSRKNIKLILLLVDSRREPDQDDLAMLQFANFTKCPMAVVMTKTDKLNQSELHKQTALFEHLFLGYPIFKYRIDNEKARLNLLHYIVEST